MASRSKPIAESHTQAAKAKRREIITISFVGNKKFKQLLVDKIAELLQSEDIFDEAAKPGCGFTMESTIEPSGEYE
jgi:hypothetical protein